MLRPRSPDDAMMMRLAPVDGRWVERWDNAYGDEVRQLRRSPGVERLLFGADGADDSLWRADWGRVKWSVLRT